MEYSKNFIELLYMIETLPKTSDPYPSYIEPAFQDAISFKRSGLYELSFSVFKKILSSERIVYTGLLNGIFKVAAAAGYLGATRRLLNIGNRAMRGVYSPLGMNNFEDHMNRLAAAIDDRDDLFEYIKSISGNPNYSFPYSYMEMRSDYYNH